MSAPTTIGVGSFYPLYDMLRTQIESAPDKDKQLSDEEIRSLLLKINSLDKLGRDMIYIWVRIHSLRSSNSKLMEIPFGGEKIDSRMQENDIVCDVKFDLRNFPPILNRMLLRFTDLHKRKMLEDSKRGDIQ